MAKCPKCHKKIEGLYEYREERYWTVLEADGESLYGEPEGRITQEETDWECPECGSILTDDYDEAVKILKG